MIKNTIILLVILCFSCKGQKKVSQEEQELLNSNLTLLVEDNYSGIPEAETFVISNEKELQKFYSKINRTRKPGLKQPKVDFSKDVLVVVCEGEHKEGNSLKLEVLKITDQEIELNTKKNISNIDSGTIISPFRVFRLNNNRKSIIFNTKTTD